MKMCILFSSKEKIKFLKTQCKINKNRVFCGFLNEPRFFAPPVIDPMFVNQVRNEKIDRLVLNQVSIFLLDLWAKWSLAWLPRRRNCSLIGINWPYFRLTHNRTSLRNSKILIIFIKPNIKSKIKY
jgi:hypothetical protein